MSRYGVLAFLAGVALALSTGSAAVQATLSKRVGTIAFIRLVDGPGYGGRLFVVRPDGGGLRPLTPRRTSVWSYAWSPDGRFVAYIDERFSLWLVRRDGAARRMLLPSSRLRSFGLSWSPDGKSIAIVSPGPNANPARAPSGGEIAYGDGGEVLGVVSRDGGRPRLLLSSGVGAPQWSPDGTKLAAPTVIHLGQRRALRYHRITVVDANGRDPHVVTDHAYTEYPFAWSPNSRQILYGKQDRQGIYVIGVDGRGDHRVTRDSPPQALWGALAWSPTGDSIAYIAGGTDDTDLYLIGSDGRGKFRLTATPDKDIAPSWVAR
jgi:Tol biopolymer transport system component